MIAARIHAYGGPDVFQLEEVEPPTAGPDDIVVRVHASSVNPVDYKIRSGSQRGAVRLKLPWILGMDVSGVVTDLGEGVTEFAVGDEVFASPTHRRPGTYADYVAIDAGAAARKPASISHQQAASLPLVALTAWDCLVGAADVAPEQKVFIQAGSGGVGTVAIQLAKRLGATVATTCSARNVDFVKGLGADVVIDYTKEKFEDVLSDYDVVLESMGGEFHQRSLEVLGRGGTLASINSGLPGATKKYGPNLGLLVVGGRLLGRKVGSKLKRGINVKMVVRKSSGANLAKLAEMVDEGAIKPQIAKVFPLAEIAAAHRMIETGRTRGKIVIAIADE